MVNNPGNALAGADSHYLFDNVIKGHRIGEYSPGTGPAAEGTISASYNLRRFILFKRCLPFNKWYEEIISLNHFSVVREVERADRDLFSPYIVPDVKFCPVGERKDANRFAWSDPAIVQVPQFRALLLRIPLAMRVTKAVYPLLCA